MPREIDSSALLLANRILGLAGGQSPSGITELDDGWVNQVLNINDIVRRSRTQIGTGGWFHALLENVHGAGASTLTSTIDPYNVSVGLANPPYPPDIPNPGDFDAWILGASLEMTAGTATNFTDGMLAVVSPASNLAYSIDDQGAPSTRIAAGQEMQLGRWDVLELIAGNTVGLTEQGSPWIGSNLRMRPGCSIQLRSGASNAVTVNAIVLVGLLPAGLGQDIVT